MRYVERRLSADLTYIDLYGVSDIHRGHPCFNERAWYTLLEKIKHDPHARMVLNGDGVEAALKSSRYGNTYATRRPREERKLLTKDLEAVRDKIDAVTLGNHDIRPERDSDENPLERMCDDLDLLDRYDPGSVLLDIGFGKYDHSPKKVTTFNFFIAHGTGGGRRPGAKINRLQEWAWVVDGVDGYISGHVHDLQGRVEYRFYPDPQNKKILQRPIAYVIAGSMLDYGDYAEANLYTPSAVSFPVLRLHQKRQADSHKHMEIILPTRIRPSA